MAGNSNLHMSRSGKTDEFYTQLSTIEDELRHYRSYFKGKVISVTRMTLPLEKMDKIIMVMVLVDIQVTFSAIFS